MASQPLRTALPVELLYRVVDQVRNPTDLANLSCTCSTMNSIVNSKPLRLYEIDAEFHSERLERRMFNKRVDEHWIRQHRYGGIAPDISKDLERPPTVPSLVHVIRTRPLEHIKEVLQIFQTKFNRKNMNCKFSKELTTPAEAAIRSGRVDVLRLLAEHNFDFTVNFDSLERSNMTRLEKAYENIGFRSGADSFELVRPYLLALLCGQDESALFFFENLENLFNYKFYAWYLAVQTRNEKLAIQLFPSIKRYLVNSSAVQKAALNSAVSINSHELIHSILAAVDKGSQIEARNDNTNEGFHGDHYDSSSDSSEGYSSDDSDDSGMTRIFAWN
ncbi:hypothetical protein GQX73_g470 [Xylaria multiplex]|uniref:F-box domain-containing protein n=1 Tax=Xylaria multiplex TaxID=323545 RepID=A0A7C8IY05_9PEZI|nr:hypothetical protein GQX73_g470 [Xylaria multiplex]